MLSQYEVIINVDESFFSRHTKAIYSWSKKGKPTELNKIEFINSTSMITAISPKGKVFSMSTTGSVDSSLFLKFLKNLRRFIEME